MAESHLEGSSIGIVKRGGTPHTDITNSRSSIRNAKVANLFETKHSRFDEGSSGHSMVIKPNKLKSKRKQLPKSMFLTPVYKLGSLLRVNA